MLASQRGQHGVWVFPVPRWATDEAGNGVRVADAPTGKVSNHAWRKACIRAGLPTLRFHDLRHTWASWHVQAGTPLAVLQDLGGWASLSMVQRYAHLGATHVAAWAGNTLASAATARPGTNPAQAPVDGTNNNGPEGPLIEENLGWLIGLEPTTTRITICSGASDTNKIKHLAVRKKPKTA